MVFVNAWLRYRKLVIRGSAETLPTCRRVLNRFAAIFKVGVSVSVSVSVSGSVYVSVYVSVSVWMCVWVCVCVCACVRACVFVSVWFPLVMEAI